MQHLIVQDHLPNSKNWLINWWKPECLFRFTSLRHTIPRIRLSRSYKIFKYKSIGWEKNKHQWISNAFSTKNLKSMRGCVNKYVHGEVPLQWYDKGSQWYRTFIVVPPSNRKSCQQSSLWTLSATIQRSKQRPSDCTTCKAIGRNLIKIRQRGIWQFTSIWYNQTYWSSLKRKDNTIRLWGDFGLLNEATKPDRNSHRMRSTKNALLAHATNSERIECKNLLHILWSLRNTVISHPRNILF